MSRRLQPWVAHPKGTTPQAMAATLRRSAHSFETLHPVHYFLARVPLVRVRSRCQWVAACSNPKTYYMRPVPSSMFFLTISMRLLRSGAQALAHHHKQTRQRHFLKTGLRARRRLAHFTPTYETDSSQDRKSTRLNSSHQIISYAVFC